MCFWGQSDSQSLLQTKCLSLVFEPTTFWLTSRHIAIPINASRLTSSLGRKGFLKSLPVVSRTAWERHEPLTSTNQPHWASWTGRVSAPYLHPWHGFKSCHTSFFIFCLLAVRLRMVPHGGPTIPFFVELGSGLRCTATAKSSAYH